MSQAVSNPAAQSNTRTVAKNSFWYGVEMAFTIVMMFVSSVIMARALGPQKLGYFNYVMWLTNLTGNLGSLGIPLAAAKYMAEYFGAGRTGMVRTIFFAALRQQSILASLLTAVALGVVFLFGDPAHRAVSAVQVASMFPVMIVYIPSRANAAREDLKANVSGSVVSAILYFVSIVLSLRLGYGLMGIAIGILLSRVGELVVRLVPVMRWVSAFQAEPLPDQVLSRMRSYSAKAVMLMLVNMIVFDRSDMIFLKWLSSDIRQISFYSVAFNVASQALVLPQTVVSGIGPTIFAQYGRDKDRLPALTSAATRYVLLFSVPILWGLAALSGPAVRLVYGLQYVPAISVLAVSAVLALPKPLIGPPVSLLEAAEQQTFLVRCSAACAVLNVVLDILLIPQKAALGAAIANGTAQTVYGLAVWVHAKRAFNMSLDYLSMGKIVVAGVLMVLSTFPVLRLRAAWALPLGTLVGFLTFCVALRLLRPFHQEDTQRLSQLDRLIPRLLRPGFTLFVQMIMDRKLA